LLGWEEIKYSLLTNSKSDVFESIPIVFSFSNCSLLVFFHILILLLSAVAMYLSANWIHLLKCESLSSVSIISWFFIKNSFSSK